MTCTRNGSPSRCEPEIICTHEPRRHGEDGHACLGRGERADLLQGNSLGHTSRATRPGVTAIGTQRHEGIASRAQQQLIPGMQTRVTMEESARRGGPAG